MLSEPILSARLSMPESTIGEVLSSADMAVVAGMSDVLRKGCELALRGGGGLVTLLLFDIVGQQSQ